MRALLLAVLLAVMPTTPAQASQSFDDEVIYHVFFRSFADSDGDRIGDFRGLTPKLDYLRDLGVTSLLLTPVLPSPFYHNYFPTDFRGIERSYGTRDDYLRFLREAHARNMKVYLDIEIQYVAEGHPWWTQRSANLLWRDRTRGVPEPFLNQPKWESYDGTWHGIAMIDLNRAEAAREIRNAMMFWADPHGDGSGREGADGFRIDHMMDDLDNKGLAKDLFRTLWRPVFRELRAMRPHFRIIAEQSDWGFGERWLTDGDADAVFAFPLRGAILKLDRDGIVKALQDTSSKTPSGKHHITFLENHDTDRAMSVFGGDVRKLKLATAIMLFSPGTPLLYYGEEIGMRGVTRKGTLSDGAHVPLREAMRWRRDENAAGAATWYAGDAKSWNTRFNRGGDGVSVEEQSTQAGSLLHWHREMLKLRSTRGELRSGVLRIHCRQVAGILCMERVLGKRRSLLIANLTAKPMSVRKLIREAGITGYGNATPSVVAPFASVILTE